MPKHSDIRQIAPSLDYALLPQKTSCCQKFAPAVEEKYSANLLWMKKASLEELLLPNLQPETMHYPGGVYRWSDDTLPVVSSQTATQRYT